MKPSFKNKSILSIADLKKDEIIYVLKIASNFKKKPPQNLLKGFILASCFFDSSTRTRLSFESAMLRLGGAVIGFSDATNISTQKGESLQDSIRVISEYADILVLRHPREGAARLASEVSDKPIINAGDGSNQHPTQTLLDLFTMQQCQGKLEGLKIAMVGDLKHGRTVHSLAPACAHFDMRFYFISPPHLSIPDSICHELRKKEIKFSFHQTIEEVIDKVDILYMTRIQKERFAEGDSIPAKAPYVLREDMLKKASKNLKIFHPLPRVEEIEKSVDTSPHAYYFEQAQNGLPVRQALIALTLGKIS